ncbi:MAG TPA: 3-hydroxyacyl-CoA dehydrogenase family protein [Candidatus Caldiarchaeum subterraneum]|uniref:3-hydroxyacyl-CoA dehydrogenase family protein n=1 Tax=Caldiarchaeum subterraneum TaxID=311458 RepID=A0A832ZY72_CALS0|nr:3-hydroxyacyl-CoA dehydrogenase family protein [Candidatus Caldarchaeum subterraneum]
MSRRIAVLGAGLMGHGIAQVAAQTAGYEVYLVDVEQRFLDRGMEQIRWSLNKLVEKKTIAGEDAEKTLSRIHPTLSYEEACSDVELVIEAVPEDVEIKKQVWKKVDAIAPKDTVLASNTSSISITQLASYTSRPQRFCGLHFFNPPQLMKLVEIIRGRLTSDETIEYAKQVVTEMGKEYVLVNKDVAGFIVNRILVPALNEAVQLVYEGVATPEDVDKAVKLGLNWPMGAITLLDYVGLDTTLHVLEVLMNDYQDPKYRPSPLLREMVRAGLYGRKSGRGFYTYEKKQP